MGFAGSGIGGKIGSGIGTAIAPGPGTGAGAVIGSVSGAIIGAGISIASNVSSRQEETYAELAEAYKSKVLMQAEEQGIDLEKIYANARS